MSTRYKLSNSIEIQVEGAPFASGGEGDLFRILSPLSLQSQVLKVYKKEKRTKQRENKLNFLVRNPPALNNVGGHNSIIWPTHLAFQDENFVGYTMPIANGIKLELLCHPKLPKKIGDIWNRFDLSAPGSKKLRHAICFNIAAAISQIHSYGSYVLVDLKPDNIIIQPNGKISIIDIDSTEVIQSNRLLFPAQVLTPEYTPPEYYTSIKNIEINLIEETWDRFSLGVIFYRLLLGIHPFTGSLNPPYDQLSNTSDLIENGLFPNGINRGKFKVIPKPHEHFIKLEENIKLLFLNVFDKGHSEPNRRSSADDWCRHLSPDQGVQINRLLPSKQAHVFKKIHASTVALPKAPQLKFSKPDYVVINYKPNFLERLTKVFYQPQRLRKLNLVRHEQIHCDLIICQIEEINKRSKELRKKYSDAQEQIIIEEASKIKVLLEKYKKIEAMVDEKGRLLFKEEAQKLILYDQDFKKQFNAIELRIKGEYDINVHSVERRYQSQIDQLTREIKLVEDEESSKICSIDSKLSSELNKIKEQVQTLEKEITNKIDNDALLKLLKIKKLREELNKEIIKSLVTALENYQANYIQEQLKQYKISSDAHSIFTDSYANPDQLASYLSIKGITTAADFSAVNESGYILTKNGTWIKVSGVANYRAKCLGNWRSRIERNLPTTPPQTLPYTKEAEVKAIFQSKFDKLDQDEQVIKAEAINKKKNIPKQLKEDFANASKMEQEITFKLSGEKGKISAEYALKKNNLLTRKNTLHKQAHAIISANKVNFENSVGKWKLELENLKKSRDTFIEQTKKIFDLKHLSFVKELNELDKKFNGEQQQILSFSQAKLENYKEELKKEYKRIIEDLHTLNSKATIAFEKLNNIQTEYRKVASAVTS